RAIARRVGEINRRLEARDEPFVAVGSRIRQAGERGSVFQNSTDEKERSLTQASVTVAGKERFFVFPKRHVGVHARPVIGKVRFRYERDRFVVTLGDVTQDALVILHVVAHAFEGVVPDVDLGLSRCRELVMLPTYRY